MLNNLAAFILLPIASCLYLTAVQAQIVPNGSLGSENSQVIPLNPGINRIEGGSLRGNLLFHSFQDFNVRQGESVFFGERQNVRTIFSRVTGTNPSLIFGKLGVEGNANLFFINPNGIVFGSGSSLDIRGAFVGSTADRITFPDGSIFSATDPQSAPLLTIDIPTPIGLEFAINNPASIINASPLTVDGNFTLVGGAIASSQNIASLNGNLGLITVPNSSNSLVQLDANGSYLQRQILNSTGSRSLPNNPKASLSNLVTLSETGFSVNSQGIVTPIGLNIPVEAGDIIFSGSYLSTGIDLFAGTSGSGGKINLDASNNINFVLSASGIDSAAFSLSSNRAGDIILKAGKDINLEQASILNYHLYPETPNTNIGVFLESGRDIKVRKSTISTNTFNQIPAGSIVLNAARNIELDNASVKTVGEFQSSGDVGNIKLNALNISLVNNSQITSTVGFETKGNTGSITVAALDDISLDRSSAIANSVQTGSTGKIGNIYLSGNNLTLNDRSHVQNFFAEETKQDGGKIDVNFANNIALIGNSYISHNTSPLSTRAGDIKINTENLWLRDNSSIYNLNSGQGRNGKLTINASDNIDLDSKSSIFHSRLILSPNFTVSSPETDLKITARNIKLANESQISNRTARSFDTGERLFLAGNLEISASSLTLTNNSQISSDALGNSISAGKIDINSAREIKLDKFGRIGSNISAESLGNPGQIAIATPKLTLTRHSQIVAEVESGALARIPSQIDIKAPEIELSQSQISSEVQPTATGRGGNINIQTDTLKLSRQAEITASTSGRGDGGDINLLAQNSILLDDSSVIQSQASRGALGNGGRLEIQTGALKLSGGSSVTTSSAGQPTANAGTINITASQVGLRGNSQLTATTLAGQGGNINLTGSSLTALEGSQISTATHSAKPAGDINLALSGNLFLSGANTGIFANTAATSTARGGNIFVKAKDLKISDRAGLFVDSRGSGTGGSIGIEASQLLLDRSQISAETASNTGGNIKIDVGGTLQLRNGSQIAASAGRNGLSGDGGNIEISAGFVVSVPSENSDIAANAFLGNGGNIEIEAIGLVGIVLRSNLTNLSDITASSDFGPSGYIGLETLNGNPIQGLQSLPKFTADLAVIEGCQSQSDRSPARFYRLGTHTLLPNPDRYLDSEPTSQWVSWANTPVNYERAVREVDPPQQASLAVRLPCE